MKKYIINFYFLLIGVVNAYEDRLEIEIRTSKHSGTVTLVMNRVLPGSYIDPLLELNSGPQTPIRSRIMSAEMRHELSEASEALTSEGLPVEWNTFQDVSFITYKFSLIIGDNPLDPEHSRLARLLRRYSNRFIGIFRRRPPKIPGPRNLIIKDPFSNKTIFEGKGSRADVLSRLAEIANCGPEEVGVTLHPCTSYKLSELPEGLVLSVLGFLPDYSFVSPNKNPLFADNQMGALEVYALVTRNGSMVKDMAEQCRLL